jgi:hypothetical protein
MLLQQVAKSFIGELLEVHHAIPGKQVERVPRLVIELDSLASHIRPLSAMRVVYSTLVNHRERDPDVADERLRVSRDSGTKALTGGGYRSGKWPA